MHHLAGPDHRRRQVSRKATTQLTPAQSHTLPTPLECPALLPASLALKLPRHVMMSCLMNVPRPVGNLSTNEDRGNTSTRQLGTRGTCAISCMTSSTPALPEGNWLSQSMLSRTRAFDGHVSLAPSAAAKSPSPTSTKSAQLTRHTIVLTLLFPNLRRYVLAFSRNENGQRNNTRSN